MTNVPKRPEGAKAEPCPEAEAPAPITFRDLWEVSEFLAAARSALDDFWFLANDAAAPPGERTITRASIRRAIHADGYRVLQMIRAAELHLAGLHKRASK